MTNDITFSELQEHLNKIGQCLKEDTQYGILQNLLIAAREYINSHVKFENNEYVNIFTDYSHLIFSFRYNDFSQRVRIRVYKKISRAYLGMRNEYATKYTFSLVEVEAKYSWLKFSDVFKELYDYKAEFLKEKSDALSEFKDYLSELGITEEQFTTALDKFKEYDEV